MTDTELEELAKKLFNIRKCDYVHMRPFEELSKPVHDSWINIAREVAAMVVAARIDEHTAGCIRCKSEVMMETGMSQCKMGEDLQTQLTALRKGNI